MLPFIYSDVTLMYLFTDVNNGSNCVRTTKSFRSSKTTAPAKCPRVSEYVLNILNEKITSYGLLKKSEYPFTTLARIISCLTRYLLYCVVIRVLHKGSIPTGGQLIISPKTTGHSNMTTWTEMSTLISIFCKSLIVNIYFDFIVFSHRGR